MDTRTISIAVGGLVLAIGGMFTAAYFLSSEDEPVDESTEAGQVEGESETAGQYDYIDRVTAKQFYEDGTHTLVGELTMPTPCDLLEVSSTYGDEASVHLDFTVVNTAEACTQVMTEQRFMTTVEAPEDVQFTAELMGRSIEVNLIPPEPGETPDDFELFIKG